MKLISFGIRHGKPDGFTIDIRPLFGRNPYHNRKLRKLRGTDQAVQEDILKTPNFEKNYNELKERVLFVSKHQDQPVVIYIGCTGGHHRSVYLVERLGRELGCSIEHRDFYKP